MPLNDQVTENKSVSTFPFLHFGQVRQNGQDTDSAEINIKRFSRWSFITDFILLNISFLIIKSIKLGAFVLDGQYLSLLFMVNAGCLLTALFTGKYKLKNYSSFRRGTGFIIKSILASLYATAIMMMIFQTYFFSRMQFFGTFALYLFLSLAVFVLFYMTGGRNLIIRLNGHLSGELQPPRFSLRFILFDFMLLTLAFYSIQHFKRGTFSLTDDYERVLLLAYGVWAAAGLFTRKFEKGAFKNIYYALTPHIKAFLLMLAMMSLLVFALHLFEFSRLQVFGTFFLYIVLELPLFYLYRLAGLQSDKDVERIQDVQNTLYEELAYKYENHTGKIDAGPFRAVRNKLFNRIKEEQPGLFEFIAGQIDLDLIDERETLFLDTSTSSNLEIVEDHSLSLLLNLHKVNDFRWLNRYFLQAHRKIRNSGYFIGQAHTLATHKAWLYDKYSDVIASVIYPIDFLFARVIPKFPFLKQAYFFITRGRNRHLSKAEVLGRLVFCGFKIVAEREINKRMYFIAQRVKNPSLDKNPSYGPMIKLKRVGLDGKLIYIRKLRTMHPYSEYLQQYIYDHYNLQDNGKFHNDFRLTEWGKWFRRLWIDELPQLLNFIQGDLSLVGVRALSQHYFDLYPQDVKELRIKFKPGLIPPYYADMPKSFDEIVQSERRYLLAKQERPFVTDIVYFFKAWFNILFRHARSR